MKRLSLAVFVLLMLVGCGEPRADATNAQTLSESIKKMAVNMTGKEPERFYRAVGFLQKVEPPEEGEPADPRPKEEIVYQRIHNKTVAEIYATVEALNLARAPKRLVEMKASATTGFHEGQRMANSYRRDAYLEGEKLESLATSPEIVDRDGNPVSKEAEATRHRNLIAAYEKTADAFVALADEWREFALWVDETSDIDEVQAKYDELILRQKHIYNDLDQIINANRPPLLPSPATPPPPPQ